MSAVVVSIHEARRPRRVEGQRLELPELADVDAYIALAEEDRWFARGRGDWLEVRVLSRDIAEAEELRAVVLRRAAMRVVKGGRR